MDLLTVLFYIKVVCLGINVFLFIAIWKLTQTPAVSPIKIERVGLVIAHPDDEVMFFMPTINRFIESGKEVSILCLCDGDYDGLGKTRQKEFENSCKRARIKHYQIIRDEKIRDGPLEEWESDDIYPYLQDFIHQHQLQLIITFDVYGISGHPNHIAVHHAVVDYSHTDTEILYYQLQSISILRKYIIPIDLICIGLSYVGIYQPPYLEDIWVTNPFPASVHHHMTLYKSQYVWFRRLYSWLSRYCYYNQLTPLP